MLTNYTEILNFGVLECPNCHSNELIRWGFYEKGVIFCDDNNACKVLSEEMGACHLFHFASFPFIKFAIYFNKNFTKGQNKMKNRKFNITNRIFSI